MIKQGSMVAVVHGTMKGKFLVLVKKYTDQYHFLSLPDMEVMKIPVTDVDEGLEKKVLDIVEVLPDEVYNLCIAQYEKSNS
jgi:hypothetical protein